MLIFPVQATNPLLPFKITVCPALHEGTRIGTKSLFELKKFLRTSEIHFKNKTINLPLASGGFVLFCWFFLRQGGKGFISQHKNTVQVHIGFSLYSACCID